MILGDLSFISPIKKMSSIDQDNSSDELLKRLSKAENENFSKSLLNTVILSAGFFFIFTGFYTLQIYEGIINGIVGLWGMAL